jgi:large subunit ribosomal protein L17
MLRALTANLVAHERIETTEAKAKELRRVAERLITRARRLGPLAYTPHEKLSIADRARRQAAHQQMSRFLQRFAVVQKGGEETKIDLVEKVFNDLAKRFKDRPGGYTRIMKLGARRGDNAPMTLIELVDRQEPSAKAAAEPKAEKPAATQASTKADEPKKTASKADKKSEAEAKSKGSAAPKTEAKKASASKAAPKDDKAAPKKAAAKAKADPKAKE